ncbi:MAG: acetylornithine transaminase [Rhodospirillales bacterium]
MIPALMPTYARTDIAFERGEGAYLFDETGKRYLDFAAGIAVNALGHAHPALVKAVTEQAQKLWHVSNLYRVPGQERVAEMLVKHTFADTVFFTNSGAEAVECAIKMARRCHAHNGRPERFRVITVEGAFHGRTLATIAAGRQEKHLDGFGPAVEGFDQAPFGNLNALRAAIGPETAAVLAEPIQGEGGVRACDLEYLRGLRAAADEFGLLLIFDEVQCGMGRTGKLFAHEHAGVAPDIMASAKGLGGGFPIGACLATEAAAKAMTAGSHGSTFGGNPLAVAAAQAVLETMLADGFLNRIGPLSARLWDGLSQIRKRHPSVITEVRGAGLMLGIKTVDAARMVEALRARALLTAPAGDGVVRLLPPLIIENAEIDEALAAVSAAAADLERDAA